MRLLLFLQFYVALSVVCLAQNKSIAYPKVKNPIVDRTSNKPSEISDEATLYSKTHPDEVVLTAYIGNKFTENYASHGEAAQVIYNSLDNKMFVEEAETQLKMFFKVQVNGTSNVRFGVNINGEVMCDKAGNGACLYNQFTLEKKSLDFAKKASLYMH